MALDEILKRHESRQQSDRILPAEHERLQKIDALMGVGNAYEALGHLNEQQIWALSVYRAFDEHLKAGGVVGGIEPVLHLMENYLYLSPSIDRMGRMEVVAALKGSPRYTEPWAEPEINPGFWERLFGRKRTPPAGGDQR
jgi:hypothetical protein